MPRTASAPSWKRSPLRMASLKAHAEAVDAESQEGSSLVWKEDVQNGSTSAVRL